RIDPEHLAFGPLVVTANHPDGITLGDVGLYCLGQWLGANPPRFLVEQRLHYSTSGASDTIFMNFFSRSSRPTGPKMRVARGSPSSLISTAAFSSNRMYEPSLRRV